MLPKRDWYWVTRDLVCERAHSRVQVWHSDREPKCIEDPKETFWDPDKEDYTDVPAELFESILGHTFLVTAALKVKISFEIL